MCCIDFTKKIIPFVVTFTIGIFVASFFYSLTNWNSRSEFHFDPFVKESKYKRTSCGFERRVKKQHDIMEMVPAVPVSPPPPPAPPIAPEPPAAPPPLPPKPIVLRQDVEKQNK